MIIYMYFFKFIKNRKRVYLTLYLMVPKCLIKLIKMYLKIICLKKKIIYLDLKE